MQEDAKGAGPVAFMHVPKSAGSAITRALETRPGVGPILRGYDRTLFGGFCAFETIADKERNSIFLDGLPQDRDAALVAGHISLATIRAVYPGARAFSIVREGRVRILSHFLYYRSLPDAQLQVWGGWADYIRKSHNPLIDFLSDPALVGVTDNLFTRFLLAPHKHIPQDNFIPVEDHDLVYEAARQRLADLDFVIPLESPTMKQDLEQWLGATLSIAEVNVTSLSSVAPVSLSLEMTPEALDRLNSLSAIDQQLWCYISEKSGSFRDPRMQSDALFLRYLMRQEAKLGLHQQLAENEDLRRKPSLDLNRANDLIKRLERKGSALASSLDAIRNSRSWKLTRPLRQIRRGLFGHWANIF